MRRLLRYSLLLIVIYLIYIGLGMVLTITGTRDTWWVFPGKMLATNEYGRDTSVAGTDGPYVFYYNNQIIVKRIVFGSNTALPIIDSFSQSSKDTLSLQCNFKDNPGWNFKIKLKDSLTFESSEYSQPDSILVISDIEGEFAAFRKLLIVNNIMNEQYEWTFNKGHLVLIGDFFDRGLNVTECLWLIYYLESEAENAGGKVHFILGNHEIMNMGGDFRYVRNKYFQNAKLLGTKYNTLYSKNTELGRWLNTKNIAEKIGNCLFVHGGFSDEINQLKMPLSQLNETCRKGYFLNDSTRRCNFSDTMKMLYSGKTSPFWYRELASEKAENIVVDMTLSLYNIETIFIGHTVVDEITGFYDNKVIDVDVKHSQNNSQAVMYANNKFYIVDTSGIKALIQ